MRSEKAQNPRLYEFLLAEARAARRRRRRRALADNGFWIALAIFCACVAGLLVAGFIAGCHDPCRTQSDEQYRYHERETRNPELGTDPAGRHLPAIGQKDCGPTASRRPTRAAEDAAILPAQPPVQNAVIVPSSGFRVSRLLDAIRQVESSGRPDPPDRDGGRSIGPYQIQRDYWTDAGVPWPYQAVRSEREGRATVLAYWRRRAPEALAAGDLQVLARIHNGGPKWAAKPTTLDYWRRVLTVLPSVRFNAENAEKAETKG